MKSYSAVSADKENIFTVCYVFKAKNDKEAIKEAKRKLNHLITKVETDFNRVTYEWEKVIFELKKTKNATKYRNIKRLRQQRL